MLTSQRLRHKTTPVQPVGRRQRRTAKPAPERTAGPVTDAFLSHTFEPVYLDTDTDELFILQNQIEAEFFTSLTHLAGLYGWPPESLQNDYPYPLNIAVTHQTAQFHLHQINPHLRLVIINQSEDCDTRATHRATLAIYEEYETKEYNYYVPVEPFYNQLKSRENRPRTALIESVFAYLYQRAKVPYHATDSSFMGWQVECVKDYFAGEFDWGRENAEEATPESTEEMTEVLALIDQKWNHTSSACLRLFNRPGVLEAFGQRLAGFVPVSEPDKKMHLAATGLYNLYQQYPQRNILDAVNTGIVEENEYGEGLIEIDHYVSFVWATDDDVFSQIGESLDNEYNAGAQIDHPKSVQVFDQPQSRLTVDLDFESCFYPLTDDFITSLYQIDKEYHEQHNPSVSADLPANTGTGDLLPHEGAE